MSCPLCQKRKPKRFCPAAGEKICAVCCGTYREVTMDCPSDCPHLAAARRYDSEHRQALRPEEIPYPEIRVSPQRIAEREEVIVLAGRALAAAAHQLRATDADAIAALAAMVETYRTLESGIYYERAPESHQARQLYAELAKTLADYKKAAAERIGFAALRDAEILELLVFLLRLAKRETSGRPRSRAFFDYLRATLGSPEPQAESSRILMP